MFAAVKTDFSFSYVLAGAEGSINDATLCAQAFGRSFRVPPNRYYLVDAGFGVRNGIVVPFPGIRYHLEDWRNAARPVETKKELYNFVTRAGIPGLEQSAAGGTGKTKCIDKNNLQWPREVYEERKRSSGAI